MFGLGIDDSLRGRRGRISVTHIELRRQRIVTEGNVDVLGRPTALRGEVGLLHLTRSRRRSKPRDLVVVGLDTDRGAIDVERGAASPGEGVGVLAGDVLDALSLGRARRGADGSASSLVVRVGLAKERHDEGRGSKGLLWCSGRRKVRVMNAKHVTSVSRNVFYSLELDLFNDQTATSVHLFRQQINRCSIHLPLY